LKVVHLSTSDKGGAGIAAMRLHKELLRQGIDSHIITKYRLGPHVKNHYVFSESYKARFVEKLKKYALYKIGKDKPYEMRISEKHLKNRPQGFEYFSFPFSDLKVEEHPILKASDIIHLHWISEGFINYSSFFKNLTKKLVWTLHDMNPFTGGCHHSDNCEKYRNECRKCPQLQNTIDESYSLKMQRLKEDALKRIVNEQLKVVTPSKWLGAKSLESTLFKRFKHFCIPNGIDASIFFGSDKKTAREKLYLPLDKKIILFVSNEVSNKRKGIFLLERALNLLPDNNKVVLCTLGHKAVKLNTGFTQFALNYISDESEIALAYSAADVFVLPSMAENFPNTICESLVCNTPVVAFNVGGIPEQVNNKNGALVDAFDVQKLSDAIQKMLNSSIGHNSGEISAEAIKKYSITSIAEEYIRLYN
jgi:glycosyltransferase involved in cell wall biosynthesis